MKKYINILIITFFMIVVMFLSGCWSAHELNTIGIVMGLGIDKANEKGQVKLTAQIFKPSNSKDVSTSNTANAYLNLSNEGITIGDTLHGFNHMSSRKLFYSDNKVIIFSKSIAEEGIEKYIDFFLRNRETRLLVSILIADGSAGEILNSNPCLETIGAKNIGNLVQLQDQVSTNANVNLKKFADRLMSKTTAPIIPIIKISNDEKNNVPYINETAVFNKTKMIGRLNTFETRGLLWAINEVKGGTMVVSIPNTSENFTLEITRSKSKIIPKIENKNVLMNISVEEEGDLYDQTSDDNYATPKTFEKLEKIKKEKIRKEILSAWKKAKELNADIFGFGDCIYQYYPNEWNNMASNWNEIFQKIEVKVNVKAKLRRTGRITKPATSKD